MSTFKSLDLFGSGPHRFHFGPQGYLLTLDYFNGTSGGGSTNQGITDLDIFVRGRLIATTEAALWTLRNNIRAQLTTPPVPGTLIDNAARTWPNMTLVAYTESDQRDLGRVFSISYQAQFRTP